MHHQSGRTCFLKPRIDVNDFFKIYHFLFAFNTLLEYFIQSMHKKGHWLKQNDPKNTTAIKELRCRMKDILCFSYFLNDADYRCLPTKKMDKVKSRWVKC